MSFPKRFKYKMSVSGRIGEMTFVEGNQGIVDSPYCLPSAKGPLPQWKPPRDVEYIPNDRVPLRPWREWERAAPPPRLSLLVDDRGGEKGNGENVEEIDPAIEGDRRGGLRGGALSF
jgi:hypothetical protein